MNTYIKFCKKCVMPNTRPGLRLDKNGVCEACNNYDKKKNINWDKRFNELKELCDKYRGCNGDGYDCAIAVSGGKDSTFQVYVIKELMGMNPLLISVDNWSWTETGIKNKANISESFGCDILTLSLNKKVGKKMMLKGLQQLGSPTWYIDAAIYASPVRLCMNMGLKLLIYGENVNYEYGGSQKEETYSAKEQYKNDVVKPIDWSKWLEDGITMKDLNSIKQPTINEVEEAQLEPIYLSYFVKWDTHNNYEIAKRHGFRHMEHEWAREGTIENYNQIDSPAYLINQWFKYPKFGHSSTTEMASRYIRSGKMSREEAIKLVNEKDHKLDQKILDDYCDFVGITIKEFWEIADKWYNHNLFEQNEFGVWNKKFNIE
ncbi:N-acetyl sugar amidotransferase [Lysinibacillus sp. NPDC097231]|uniref:N-acetyl sugar amidotransferase n=1 Tax=Lysinibacillus sp. NPDC097231 TaxID=3364142 RepID=UPI0037FA66FE